MWEYVRGMSYYDELALPCVLRSIAGCIFGHIK